MTQQTKDHGHDLEKFGREQSSTKSELLHQYVSETYPILQQHLALAKAVQASIATDAK
jgi:hypothetical protein